MLLQLIAKNNLNNFQVYFLKIDISVFPLFYFHINCKANDVLITCYEIYS